MRLALSFPAHEQRGKHTQLDELGVCSTKHRHVGQKKHGSQVPKPGTRGAPSSPSHGKGTLPDTVANVINRVLTVDLSMRAVEGQHHTQVQWGKALLTLQGQNQ